MNAENIHNTLKNDIAYQHAISNVDVIDMAIILRAHGFDYSMKTVCSVFDYSDALPSETKDLEPVDRAIIQITEVSA